MPYRIVDTTTGTVLFAHDQLRIVRQVYDTYWLGMQGVWVMSDGAYSAWRRHL